MTDDPEVIASLAKIKSLRGMALESMKMTEDILNQLIAETGHVKGYGKILQHDSYFDTLVLLKFAKKDFQN